MEKLDRKLVQLLAADGRMSYTDLGKATGLSTSAVHQRVRRLEERGVVQGYQAIIDPAQVGLPLTAYISLSPPRSRSAGRHPRPDPQFPRDRVLHSVAGDFNYITKVRVATPLDLEELLTRLRAAAHVQTRTTVVLSTAWEGRSVTGKEAREPKEPGQKP
jgi:Lrp/AsnC family leucine-responsive transcriptional regulator